MTSINAPEHREDPDYGFAVGRVRAQERELLGPPEYDRLLRAADEADFMSALTETTYARFLDQSREPETLEATLSRVRRDNLRFLADYCPDQWLPDLVQLKTDAFNLKVLAKRKLAGAAPAVEAVVDTGVLGSAILERLAAGARDVEPQWAARAWTSATNIGEEQADPSVVDSVFDQAAQREQLRLAQNSRFMLGYLGLSADTENIRTFMRARVLGEGGELLERAFLPGGAVSAQELAALVRSDWSDVRSHFATTEFREFVETGISGLEQKRSFRNMERNGREMRLAYLRRSRYSVFGHEPLVTFYLLRDNEVTNIRQVKAAKVAGLSEAETRELVAYVA